MASIICTEGHQSRSSTKVGQHVHRQASSDPPTECVCVGGCVFGAALQAHTLCVQLCVLLQPYASSTQCVVVSFEAAVSVRLLVTPQRLSPP